MFISSTLYSDFEFYFFLKSAVSQVQENVLDELYMILKSYSLVIILSNLI